MDDDCGDGEWNDDVDEMLIQFGSVWAMYARTDNSGESAVGSLMTVVFTTPITSAWPLHPPTAHPGDGPP